MNKTVFFRTTASAAILLIFLSCQISKPATEYSPISEIRCGSGGGFVGDESGFVIDREGLVHILKNTKQVSTKKYVAPSVREQIWSSAIMLEFDEINYVVPGNTYKFIECVVNGEVNRIAWKDSPMDEAPNSWVTFHRNFKHLATRAK